MTLAPKIADETESESRNVPLKDTGLKKAFGHNIVFRVPTNLQERVVTFSEKDGRKSGQEREVGDEDRSEAIHDSLSEDEATEGDAFSRAFLNGMASKRKTRTDSKRTSNTETKSSRDTDVGAGAVSSSSTPYSSEWLVQQLQVCCSGGGCVPWRDLYVAVFELLSSGQDSSVIQNDVRLYRNFMCEVLDL